MNEDIDTAYQMRSKIYGVLRGNMVGANYSFITIETGDDPNNSQIAIVDQDNSRVWLVSIQPARLVLADRQDTR